MDWDHTNPSDPRLMNTTIGIIRDIHHSKIIIVIVHRGIHRKKYGTKFVAIDSNKKNYDIKIIRPLLHVLR